MDLMDLENINLVPLTNIKQELLDAGGGGGGSGNGNGSSSNADNTACIGNSDNVCLAAGTSSADTATTICDSVEKQVISFPSQECIFFISFSFVKFVFPFLRRINEENNRRFVQSLNLAHAYYHALVD